jgi:hypothetical protein
VGGLRDRLFVPAEHFVSSKKLVLPRLGSAPQFAWIDIAVERDPSQALLSPLAAVAVAVPADTAVADPT